jgi:hypothetical protein
VCLSSSLGGCFESHLLQPVSPNPRSALSMYLHIRDNVQFQFGGMGDTFPHTLSRFIKKKIIILHVHVVLKSWLI